MSNIDKRALREAAEKATPGRWEYYPGNTSIEYNVDSMDEDQGSIVYVDSGDFTQKQTDLNGAFIAAANPATVLTLLDELEAVENRIAEQKEVMRQAASDISYAIFNLTGSDLSRLQPGVVETTDPTDTALIAERNLRAAAAGKGE
ncbi:ead/Ea22-like family protein [Enterobacter hormaechei]|uniref:ead/Ea22-like family protein n=1 Tax=Enterobacter hormaechei TaxID=158836 RepID=UPI0010055591|nr:ead/Ea22-like family protein [Enterobacter hormaechei]EKV3711718.1 ead/Ea22-like family protein [Enterobacter hormaechei]MCC9329337.1 ead/Ea22-like family protein [Enterobacter hormaechei subsp. steigerwaltii]MCC9335104.1 ead/Ea22-like family protein [Enterobacter hormaechei subsp. steigerwaltii]MCC9344857.1 ead/Ea22-like family protein [Enterobacter hormaechei subsp. steigerwaltii]MCC9349524.1 ead/Ea22-like family protein [Enterobacter hormaechei subsp. steigerwaltii]